MSDEKSNTVRAEDGNRRTGVIDSLFPKEFHAKATIKRESVDDKGSGHGAGVGTVDDIPAYQTDEFGRKQSVAVTTAEDLVTRVINVEDDPTLNPWTFRAFFLGTL